MREHQRYTLMEAHVSNTVTEADSATYLGFLEDYRPGENPALNSVTEVHSGATVKVEAA